MEYKLINQANEKTYAVVFDAGDVFPDQLQEFARQEKLTAAHFTAIGAFQEVTLGWFNLEKQEYEENRLSEQVEVLSLVGNIAEYEGKPKIHAHVVVGKRDSSALGGHLLRRRIGRRSRWWWSKLLGICIADLIPRLGFP